MIGARGLGAGRRAGDGSGGDGRDKDWGDRKPVLELLKDPNCWKCGSCQNMNLPLRSLCHRCALPRVPRSPIAKAPDVIPRPAPARMTVTRPELPVERRESLEVPRAFYGGSDVRHSDKSGWLCPDPQCGTISPPDKDRCVRCRLCPGE